MTRRPSSPPSGPESRQGPLGPPRGNQVATLPHRAISLCLDVPGRGCRQAAPTGQQGTTTETPLRSPEPASNRPYLQRYQVRPGGDAMALRRKLASSPIAGQPGMPATHSSCGSNPQPDPPRSATHQSQAAPPKNIRKARALTGPPGPRHLGALIKGGAEAVTQRIKRTTSSLGSCCFCHTTGQAKSSSDPARATTSRSSIYSTGREEPAGSLAPTSSFSLERETCNAAPPAPGEEAAARHASPNFHPPRRKKYGAPRHTHRQRTDTKRALTPGNGSSASSQERIATRLNANSRYHREPKPRWGALTSERAPR
ncbi:hypothetical protein C0J50_2492 [Silurus asotus]|uniref:Uncharacterized protein n=1 Tax=Silurus asotus TaxID=30991 RepID=A0AAD5B5Z1_SILAS|nr:hypothetical protein C0J50_2492 [Silurus asotus]